MLLSFYFLRDLLGTIFDITDFTSCFRIAVWGIIPVFIILLKSSPKDRFYGTLLGHFLLICGYFLLNSNHLLQHEIESYYLMVNAYVVSFSLFETNLKGQTIGKNLVNLKIESVNELKFIDYIYRNYLKFFGLIIWPISILLFLKDRTFWWNNASSCNVVSGG